MTMPTEVFAGQEPDVDPATGDERETEPNVMPVYE